jgi:hypothetical protein
MTIETEHPTFRGVACLHCRAPIPVPNIVRILQAADSETVNLPPRKSQVFNLRCPACHKEKPYRIMEILEFEGTPETTARPAGPSAVRWFPQDGITKAAKA